MSEINYVLVRCNQELCKYIQRKFDVSLEVKINLQKIHKQRKIGFTIDPRK